MVVVDLVWSDDLSDIIRLLTVENASIGALNRVINTKSVVYGVMVMMDYFRKIFEKKKGRGHQPPSNPIFKMKNS